jgi:hypothetical protein
MQKLTIPYAEFYITNVCNLACAGCNRFNNYDFRGFQRWNDYANEYKQWANEVEIRSIGILGGEPLLNPTFMDWLNGINELWPNRMIRVISNGFQLNKVSGLYEVLKNNPNVQLWVGIHNKQHKIEIMEILQEFMVGELSFEFGQLDPYQQFLWVTDSNNVRVKVEYNWWFHQGAIRHDGNTQTLHASDPEKAHDNCHMKTCHHFIRGKLYKCGVVALLPEYDSQHKFALSPGDRELMESYRPLSVDNTWEQKVEFVKNLPNAIEQCRFCPEVYNGDKIFAVKKKDIPK